MDLARSFDRMLNDKQRMMGRDAYNREIFEDGVTSLPIDGVMSFSFEEILDLLVHRTKSLFCAGMDVGQQVSREE